jgi:hypothetical protein
MVWVGNRNNYIVTDNPYPADLFRFFSGERAKGRLVVIALYGGPHLDLGGNHDGGGVVGIKKGFYSKE